MKNRFRPFLFWAFVLASLASFSVVHSALQPRLLLRFTDVLQRFFGVPADYINHAGIPGVRVAILARGFGSLPDDPHDPHNFLPPTYELQRWSEEKGVTPMEATELSGLRAAVAIWSLCGGSEKFAPQFHLYNASNLKGFELSMRDAAHWRADIVLTLQNHEGFGNFDGTGGISKLPETLVQDAQMFWVHSAGQYRSLVRHGYVSSDPRHLTTYPKTTGKWVVQQTNGYPFLRFRANASLKKVKISLSWNSYPDALEFEGTDKDLDLVLFHADSAGRPQREILRTSKRQSPNPDSEKNETSVPYEEMTVENLAPSETDYLVGVQYVGGTFAGTERFHIVLQPDNKVPFPDESEKNKGKDVLPLDFTDASPQSTLLVLADNTESFVVGDYSRYSSIGPVFDRGEKVGALKPQLILDKLSLYFNDGVGIEGPDAAAIVFAGLAVMMKAAEPGMKPKHFRDLVSNMGTRFEIRKPFVDMDAYQKSLEDLGWQCDDANRKTFYESRAAFAQLAVRPLGGGGFCVALSKTDRHPLIGVLGLPVDFAAFKDLPDSSKRDAETKSYYLYVKGSGKTATLTTWVGKQGTSAQKPWDVLGGVATDYFEVMDLSFPTLDYSSDYQKSRRFKMPKITDLSAALLK